MAPACLDQSKDSDFNDYEKLIESSEIMPSKKFQYFAALVATHIYIRSLGKES